MDWRELPDDVRMAVMRFTEAAGNTRLDLTYFDLDMALPRREYSAQQIEAVLSYLAQHGIHLSGDAEET